MGYLKTLCLLPPLIVIYVLSLLEGIDKCLKHHHQQQFLYKKTRKKLVGRKIIDDMKSWTKMDKY